MEGINGLHAKFPEADIEWRVGRCGITGQGKPWVMALAYITSRAVMDRLDDSVGPGNWRDEYENIEGGYRCTLFVRVADEWVGKQDAAPATNIEGIKGGHSDALKRAAVKWGIGRYLYQLDEGFCNKVSLEKQRGWHRAQTQDKKTIFWQPPELPEWAKP